MQLSKFSVNVLIALTFSGGALARNCKQGINYCGHTLGDIGECYRNGQIEQALYDRGAFPIDQYDNALFECIGISGGVVKFIKRCNARCVNAGSGNSDYCQ